MNACALAQQRSQGRVGHATDIRKYVIPVDRVWVCVVFNCTCERKVLSESYCKLPFARARRLTILTCTCNHHHGRRFGRERPSAESIEYIAAEGTVIHHSACCLITWMVDLLLSVINSIPFFYCELVPLRYPSFCHMLVPVVDLLRISPPLSCPLNVVVTRSLGQRSV